MQTQKKQVVQIKKFRDCYKITVCKTLIYGKKDLKPIRQKGSVNSKKLNNNISRAKKMVLEYALCNDWDFFITLTLDPKKYNRSDLKTFIKDLGQFIRDSRKKHQTDIKYLLIPELHKDGQNWHIHGLIRGLSWNDIEPHPVKKLSDKGYFNWVSYAKKFGFCSIGAIKDPVKVSMYVTKYLSKDLDKSVTEVNSKLYYNSRGLKTAEVVSEGRLLNPLPFKMAFEGLFTKSQFAESYDWFKAFYLEERGPEDDS